MKVGAYSRGGRSRGEQQALDHDMGASESYTPCGIVDEDSGQLFITFGSSSKTSDFIVDVLEQWWQSLSASEQQQCELIQLKIDNGPESSGMRTQFLRRMVEFCDASGKSVQLLYYPPYHSKYNPIERCWGILEQHWNGALLHDADTMLAWARSMTWKGLHPVVHLSHKVYEKGISLCKSAMAQVEHRLLRHPSLPKWDILIHPL